MNTSGVYQLEFSSGRTYIGKSINIQERFNQHMDKFRKGTAAKAMQTEYDHYGPPQLNVLVLCHSDHIDIIEAWLINKNNPELNSARPANPFSGVQNLDPILDKIHMSTVQHIQHIGVLDDISHKAIELVNDLTEELQDTEELIVKLNKTRSAQEIAADISNRIYTLEETLDAERKEYQARIHCLTKLVEHYKKPWWKRLFN